MNKLKFIVVGFFVGLSLFLSQVNSAGLTYNYPLYPYSKDLSQTLTFKVMLRCALPDQISNLDMSLVANYLRQIDCITRGIPKIVVLGGFQQNGHDHTYPWWAPVDDSFTAPGRRKGKEALIWLMEEAKKYNTTCTFHVNPFDAYMDSEKWNFYEENDLLCRNTDGSLVKGDIWWDRQSYFVNMVNEWNAGVTKQRIDAFLNELPLVKETGVLYFDNLTQYPASPKNRVTRADQITAIKKAAEYLKEQYNIQLIGEYADVNLYGFDCLGVTWDWNASLNIDQMEVPAYVACGGRNICHDDLLGATNDISKRRLQVFGSSIQLEDIQFQQDVSKVVREFTHHTLPYFYMNRLLRQNLSTNGYEMTLSLSDSVDSKWEGDNVHRLYRDRKLMKENYDVFIPVYWVNHLEIMAYSYQGRRGKWSLPREWKGIESVDIYEFNSSYYDLELKDSNIAITDNQIDLNLEAGVAQILVPAGTDVHDGTIYDNPASGEIDFLGEDYETQGNWKDKYGSLGYDVFGASKVLSDGIQLGYIGDNLDVYNTNSSRRVALQTPEEDGKRIEAVRTSKLHQIIDVQTAEKRMLSLYIADYKDRNCQMVVDVIDAVTKRILHSKLINSFQSGIYLRYNVKGHLQFRFTRFFYDGYGNPDYPVCSAVFIDEEGVSGKENIRWKEDNLRCYPSVFRDDLTIEADVFTSPKVHIQIHSIAGNLLYDKVFDVSDNRVRVCLDKGELGSQNGVCIVSLVTDRSVLRKKVVCR